MAAIPEFQRRRLASQRVGTPGVDTSQAAAGRVLGGALAGLSQQILDPLVKQQAVRVQQTRKIQQVSDANRANRDSLAYKNQVRQIKVDHAKEGGDQKSLDDKMNTHRDTFFKDDDTSDYRAAFSKKANVHMNRTSEEFFKEQQEAKLIGIRDDLNETLNEGAAFISKAFSDPQGGLLGMLDDYAEAVEITGVALAESKGGISAEALSAATKERNKAFATAAVNGLMDSNPESVDLFLDSGIFKELTGDAFSQEEKAEIRKDASDFKARKTKLRKDLQTQNRFDAEGDFSRRIADGESISQTELNQARIKDGQKGGITEAFAKKVTDVQKSAKIRRFLGDNVTAFAELQQEASLLGEDLDDDVTFGRIAIFRQRILEAMENKESSGITLTTGRKWLKLISPKFNEGMAEVLEEANKFTMAWRWFDDEMETFPSAEQKAQANLVLTKELMLRIDKQEQQLGRRLTSIDLKDTVDKIQEEFTLATTVRGRFRLGKIVTSRGGIKARVVGFNADGTPILNKNLRKPVLPQPIPSFEEKK